MDTPRLDEIKRRLEEITPPPWTITPDSGEYGIYHLGEPTPGYRHDDVHDRDDEDNANADFIEHSPEDTPWLLEQNASLQQRVEALERGEWIDVVACRILKTLRYAVSIARERDPERRGRTGYSDAEELEGIKITIMQALAATQDNAEEPAR